MIRRRLLATSLLVLAVPATAAASTGVVLSIDRQHHKLQVVDTRHVVSAYGYRGHLPKLHTGSLISFKRSGRTLTHIKARRGGSRSATFLARVLRSDQHGVVLRLSDGRVVTFSAKQVVHRRPQRRHGARAAAGSVPGITLNIVGLAPGLTVLVTETVDSSGNVTITITLPSGGVGGEQSASGTVSEVDTDTFIVSTTDGSDLRLHMTEANLSALNLQTCDTVDLSYHQDAGMLIADTVHKTGTDTSGDCSSDVVGTITAVSPDGLTIDTGDGSLSFTVDSSDITDGYQVGDIVDVTYSQNPDGTLNASDVEYVEQDLTGTVSAVSAGSLTVTEDGTGKTVTFTADPSSGTFDGISSGDSVDVTYHQSASGPVADCVDDYSTD